MVYTVADEDKRCGVTYVDYTKKYKAIPKPTCPKNNQCGDDEINVVIHPGNKPEGEG